METQVRNEKDTLGNLSNICPKGEQHVQDTCSEEVGKGVLYVQLGGILSDLNLSNPNDSTLNKQTADVSKRVPWFWRKLLQVAAACQLSRRDNQSKMFRMICMQARTNASNNLRLQDSEICILK